MQAGFAEWHVSRDCGSGASGIGYSGTGDEGTGNSGLCRTRAGRRAGTAQISGCSTTGPGMGGGLSDDPATEAQSTEISSAADGTDKGIGSAVVPRTVGRG